MSENMDLYRKVIHLSHFLRHGHGEPELKMAPGQHRVLTVLGGAGTMPQRDLAEALRISPPALSELLTKLEDRGLVVRERSDSDRRITMVALTARGKKQAKAMLDAESRIADKTFGALNAHDRAQLARILDKIEA